MFRRHRRGDEDQAASGPGGPAAGHPGGGYDTDAGDGGQGRDAAGGPWDANEAVPAAERIDFGSLRVPAVEGFEVQISMAEDRAAWVTVVRRDSGLQLQAFAAPKSGGLWDDVRQEIAAEIAKAGGESEEVAGPFGVELRARVAADEPGGGRGARQLVRFLGVDGPRWFLRGVISGPAASRGELARPLERVFGGVVVVRGDHPVPPRDLLEIQLPEEARQALAGEMEEPEAERWSLGPFERGPEITETR